MDKNRNTGSYSNHLYLMAGHGGDGSDKWLDGFRLASNSNEVMQVTNIIDKFGLKGLSNEIENIEKYRHIIEEKVIEWNTRKS